MQLPIKFGISNGTQKCFRPLYRFDLAHFEGQNSKKRWDIFDHIFKTTWNFHDLSKLGSPAYPQPPSLGYLKSLLVVYLRTESLNTAKIKGRK